MLTMSGCSADPSVPSMPKNMCWGAFASSAVAPLLPTGDAATVENNRPFDVFVPKDQTTYCTVRIDNAARFIAWAELRRSGKGTDWNHSARHLGTRIEAGDEAFVWGGDAAAVFECARPDIARGPTLPPSAKYIELQLTADRAPETQQTRDVLTTLMRQYVQFAKQALKCR
ncbi:hypothetical protein N4G70_00350 [Streptomyces sp. ASQP_92]|uniref:hypothetical protein n=1 Tax=Streptomyces sp. ASQP_92 TaxID=2979116 RepID=UPI0021BFD80B|nr:hypothetical protein [Streptomyces sp. ASQP_92]MCT9087315.1 hypothetical protein [Streptomyces sp. ASQP_92]